MAQLPALLRLSQAIHAVRYEDLPTPVVRRATELILDPIGCAYGGFDCQVGEAVRSMATDLGGHAESTVLGSGQRTSMPLATFVNGTMLRYLDANDYYFGRDPAHPSGNLAVALAVGEKMGCTGPQLITALVVAYEVHLRFCEFSGQPTLWQRGWHHGTNSQFSSAALAALLLRADPTQTANAMAISGSHHNTLAAMQSGEISMIKATAEAWIAKGGVEAAMLAVRGMTGPLTLLEGKFGWIESVAGEADVESIVAPIDGHYRIMNACIKPYPAVAAAMAPIHAAIALHSQVRDRLHQIKSVIVKLPSFAIASPSAKSDRRFPKTRESADHSFFYCVAIALLEGVCGDAQFAESNLHNPALHALLDKTQLEEDPVLSAAWPGAAGGAVIVQLDDGQVFESRCRFPPGHPGHPLTDVELRNKFHEYADPVMTERGASRLMDSIDTIDLCTNMQEFARQTVSDKR